MAHGPEQFGKSSDTDKFGCGKWIDRRNPREHKMFETEKESEAEGIAIEKCSRGPELGRD
jgi:hypothetical protein